MSRRRGSAAYPGLVPGTPAYRREANLTRLARRRNEQRLRACAICGRSFPVDGTAQLLSGIAEHACSATCREAYAAKRRAPGAA